jgi:hypothetical protein
VGGKGLLLSVLLLLGFCVAGICGSGCVLGAVAAIAAAVAAAALLMDTAALGGMVALMSSIEYTSSGCYVNVEGGCLSESELSLAR